MKTVVYTTKIFALIGLAFGLVYTIGGFFIDLFSTGLNEGTILASMSLVVMPILAAIPGMLIGFIIFLIKDRRTQNEPE